MILCSECNQPIDTARDYWSRIRNGRKVFVCPQCASGLVDEHTSSGLLLEIGGPPYNRPCRITTKSGTHTAKLIRLNPRFHTRAAELDVWRREDDVPKKERYIKASDVIAWETI